VYETVERGGLFPKNRFPRTIPRREDQYRCIEIQPYLYRTAPFGVSFADGNLNPVFIAAYVLHLVGLALACVLTIAAPFAWAYRERHRLASSASGRRRLVAVRATHLFLAVRNNYILIILKKTRINPQQQN